MLGAILPKLNSGELGDDISFCKEIFSRASLGAWLSFPKSEKNKSVPETVVEMKVTSDHLLEQSRKQLIRRSETVPSRMQSATKTILSGTDPDLWIISWRKSIRLEWSPSLA